MRTLLGSPSLDFMYMSASPPEAPPLSETTTGCFIRLFFWMAACIIRAIWSDAPPAPAATTISTGFVGSHADAGVNATSIASAPAVLTNRFIAFLLGGGAPRASSRGPYRRRGAATRLTGSCGPALRGSGAIATQVGERLAHAVLMVRHA